MNSFFDELIDHNNDNKSGFGAIHVSKYIQSVLDYEHIATPTEIQKRVIPVALRGSDIFACAETGSGKTLAYVVPLVQRILNSAKTSKSPRAIVVVPTRELALQVYDVVSKFSDKFSCSLITGNFYESALRFGSDVLVCTPGRLIDHLYNCPSFDIKQIETLVLDEADRLLDENFYDQLEEIIKFSSKNKQTMLFSATLNDDVKSLALLALKNPVRVFINPSSTIVKTLEEKYIKISKDDPVTREAIIAYICNERKEDSVLIFCNTKKQSHRLFIILKLLGEQVQELHGDMTQDKRNCAIDTFRNRQFRILVSTDLSSRGLDIEQISLVINFDIPNTVEKYIHRVGRTARAGKHGCAITLFSPAERKYWRAVKKVSKNCSEYLCDKDSISKYIEKINGLSKEIHEVLKNEKIAMAERELTTAENIIKFRDEIKGRPPKKFMKKSIRTDKSIKGSRPITKEFDSHKKFKRSKDATSNKFKNKSVGKYKSTTKEIPKKNSFANRKNRKGQKVKVNKSFYKNETWDQSASQKNKPKNRSK